MKDDDPNRFVCDTCHTVVAVYPSKELRVIPCGHCLTGRLICQGNVKKQVRFEAFMRLLVKIDAAYRARNEGGDA